MTAPAASWSDLNQRHLVAELDRVRRALERYAAGAPASGPSRAESAAPPDPSATMDASGEAMQLPALEQVCQAFGLSPFERDVLLLCAGVELDAAFAAACRAANGGRTAPTFALALAALDGAHWSALAPAAPLRYWRLVDAAPGEGLAGAPLRADERTLHFLAGVGGTDERLAPLVEPLPPAGALPPSQLQLAARAAGMWTQGSAAALPVLLLCGADRWTRRAVAAEACARLGLRAFAAAAADLPAAAAERDAVLRLWEREAVLGGCALLLEVDDGDPPEAARAAQAFAERVRAPVLASAREPLRAGVRAWTRLDVEKPTPDEQRSLWRGALGSAAAELNGRLDPLVAQFHLSARDIALAGAEALAGDGDVAARVWDACRERARPRLDDLAQRIETGAGWDDLVLPSAQTRTLHEVAAHVRHRARVYESWGFGRRGARGLGISALFAGPSGTGKTLAAEVIAGVLGLDLYRIDLSQVVSKYIGETEKNLRRVFDAAEEGGAVLLFDEADALFGKRSEVKDSHDRYANIEVSYLLQRMEQYRGLAVLTTNLKGALDEAFLRRLRFIVSFPFPDAVQRAGIWRRAFPPATPTEGLDPAKLAMLEVAGGNIRNIALSAAFLAADENAPVRMEHLLRAARGEMAKLEKPLSTGEVAGWV